MVEPERHEFVYYGNGFGVCGFTGCGLPREAEVHGARAVFLDPPYATSGDLYAARTEGVAEQVREWCVTAPADLRVALCGYDDEHDALLAHGWARAAGKAGGGAGYSTRSDNGRRERIWFSPACLAVDEQGDLFAEEAS